MSPDISPLSQLMLRVDAIADGAPVPDTIETGFPSLDGLLGGGARLGDLVVLGGDTGAGKSALALAIALRAAERGRMVELFSGEMDANRILERALAMEGRVAVDDIRRGSMDDAARAGLRAAAVRMRHQLPHIDRLPPGGAGALSDVVRRLASPELVIVDSLQSLPTGGVAQDEELAQTIRQLKALAGAVRVAVLVTAHLPLLNATRPDPRPTLDDFGALGAVRQHADVVLGLYREELYQPGPEAEGATELAVLKNRNGPTSYVDLYFYKKWLRFEDMVEESRG